MVYVYNEKIFTITYFSYMKGYIQWVEVKAWTQIPSFFVFDLCTLFLVVPSRALRWFSPMCTPGRPGAQPR